MAEQRPSRSRLALFRADMQDIERVCELVGHIHAPLVVRRKPAIEALQDFSRSDCRFFPRTLLIRQFHAIMVLLWAPVVDVEIISRHSAIMSYTGHSSGIASLLGFSLNRSLSGSPSTTFVNDLDGRATCQ